MNITSKIEWKKKKKKEQCNLQQRCWQKGHGRRLLGTAHRLLRNELTIPPKEYVRQNPTIFEENSASFIVKEEGGKSKDKAFLDATERFLGPDVSNLHGL
jgi:hypothetical protein